MSSSSIAAERPQRLLLIAVLLALPAVMQSALQAEAYAYRFIGVTATDVVTPDTYCKEKHSGFPPNLYTSARNDAMASWMSLGSVSKDIYSLTSGSSAGQNCPSKTKCVWTWRGGPFADNRMTFYVGNSPKVAQDASKNYYYNWEDKYPKAFVSSSTYPASVGYYAATRSWRNSYFATKNLIFVCEIVSDGDELSDSTRPTEAAVKIKSPRDGKLKWWGYVLIVIAIAVVLAIIITACCVYFNKKKQASYEHDEEEFQSNHDDDDDEDDVGNFAVGGKDVDDSMPVVAASAAGSESVGAASAGDRSIGQVSKDTPVMGVATGSPAAPDSTQLSGKPADNLNAKHEHGAEVYSRWARHSCNNKELVSLFPIAFEKPARLHDMSQLKDNAGSTAAISSKTHSHLRAETLTATKVCMQDLRDLLDVMTATQLRECDVDGIGANCESAIKLAESCEQQLAELCESAFVGHTADYIEDLSLRRSISETTRCAELLSRCYLTHL